MAHVPNRKHAFVNVTSSAPSGAPCASALPDLFGEPKPITVLISINVGLPV